MTRRPARTRSFDRFGTYPRPVRVSTGNDEMFFVTTMITVDAPEGRGTGTGFFYAVATQAGPVHFVVTARHVVARANEVTFTLLSARTPSQPALGSQLTIRLGEHRQVFCHPDPDVDVAVIPVAPWLNEAQRQGAPAFIRWLTTEHLASPEDAVDAFEEVIFVGYPKGIFDTANILPIARRGIIASPLDVDYEGLPAFLLDGAVLAGSSGSPVMMHGLTARLQRSEGRAVHLTRRSRLLGVLAASHVYSDELVVPGPERATVTVDHEASLGLVFRAHTIEEAITFACREIGLERVDGPVILEDAPEGKPDAGP